MSLFARATRLWSLDLVRGVFIFTMTLAHAIFFFHHPINPVLQVVNGFGDFVSFSGLIIVSGATAYAAYLHRRHPLKSVIVRKLKRLIIYLVGYDFLSLYIASLSSGFSVSQTYRVVTFQQLVPFTEFIIPFLILGLLNIPLKPLYEHILESRWLGLLVGVVSYLAGVFLTRTPDVGPIAWKAIWVSHTGSFSFPLLYYFPLYLMGIYFGKSLYDARQESDTLPSFANATLFGLFAVLLIVAFGTLSGISLEMLYNRWPPSLLFLTGSATITFLTFTLILSLKQLTRFPWTRRLLLILGQNAFALFFTHTFIVYTYQALGFPRVYSSLLVVVLFVASLIGALYLAKILPLNYTFALTVIEWCECRLGYCVHAHEPTLILRTKNLLIKLGSLPRRVQFNLGCHRVRPFSTKTLATTMALFFVLATPLGLVENSLLLRQITDHLQGTLSRTWVLTTHVEPLTYALVVPPLPGIVSHYQVVYQIDHGPTQTMKPLNDQSWQVSLDYTQLKPGPHVVTADITAAKVVYTTQASTFYVSAPLIVTWTIDWEGVDTPDSFINALAQIADAHSIPLTQMFNPRIYTTNTISPSRADALTQWVLNRQSQKGDEIGLHLHMFPDFVAAAGVTPKLQPAWGGGIEPGYDVLTSDYNYADMTQMLIYAKKLFSDHGLGTPFSYRAGGWFANSTTLQALNNSGFLVDTSARTQYVFGTNQVAGFWHIAPTTLPYHPSTSNQNSTSPPPVLTLLEIPDNGADDYAYSATQMTDRFDQNYDGTPLTSPRQVTFLTHPNWFDARRQKNMQTVFAHLQQASYMQDQGPVVYGTLADVYQLFTGHPYVN